MRRTVPVVIALVALLLAAVPAPAASLAVRLARLEARTSALELQVRTLRGRVNSQKAIITTLGREYICTPYVHAQNSGTPDFTLFVSTAVWPNAYYFPSKEWGDQLINGKHFNCGNPGTALRSRAGVSPTQPKPIGPGWSLADLG